MSEINNPNRFIDYFVVGVALIALIIAIVGVIRNDLAKPGGSTPVEEIEIDKAKEANEKLINDIDSIEQIKEDIINEVKELDNDSTLLLFYELLRK